MPFDIVTIAPTTVSGSLAGGDVMFNLTKVDIPARACKLISVFMEVSSATAQGDDCKIGVLFFKKNTQTTLGTLDASASISSADFTANEYIGQTFLSLTNNAGTLALDLIDNVALYYPSSSNADTDASGVDGEHLSVFEPMLLKGDAGNTEVYAAGVVHDGTPNFAGVDTVKIHFHIEY
jgi:hypothetical protein